MRCCFLDHDCYNGTGESYRGTVSMTQSGLTCQNWLNSYPHQHFFTSYNYPEIGMNHLQIQVLKMI